MRTIASVLPMAALSLLMIVSTNLVLAAPPGGAQQAQSAQQAQWAERKKTFFYQGFTSFYSCDSIHDQILDVLKQLGARPSDLKVGETGCSGPADRPSHFPGVIIRMSVLEPSEGASANGSQPSAHWHTVDLKLGDRFVNDAGSCELIAEVTKQIVPLFTTRNVEAHANCFPHQLSPADRPTLKLDVLMPDQETAKR